MDLERTPDGRKPMSEEQNQNSAAPADAAPFTVLIVGGSPENVRTLKSLMMTYVVQVLIARDSYETLAMLKRVRKKDVMRIDLVLIDVTLTPSQDLRTAQGLQIAKEIRANERAAGASPASIIAVTSPIQPVDQHICMAAGMNDYLYKPVNDESLRRLLKIWAPGLPFARPNRSASG